MLKKLFKIIIINKMMNSYINNLFDEYSKKSGVKEHVIQVPISRITNDFPILDKLWNEYKGMCNYGTEPTKQTIILNNIISKNRYFTEMRNEIMSYPNKEKYDKFEVNCSYGGKTIPKIRETYNNVWKIQNGKYTHTVNDKSFPDYYWDKELMQKMLDLGMEARGNFYYPKGAFREWHTNAYHVNGYRIYFITKGNGESYFNYVNPDTNKVVNLPDRHEYANIFYVYGTDNWDKMIWHSIYSNTDRFSLGFNVHPESLKNDVILKQ